MSPKAASSKHIAQDLASPKNYRQVSIGEGGRSKIKIVDESKMEGQKHPTDNKLYGQNLEKNKNEEHELTQNDQAKLIENVLLSLFSSSRPPAGSPTAPSPPTSESRPSRTTVAAIPTPSTAVWSTAPTYTPTTYTPTGEKTIPRTSSPTQWH